VSHRPTLALVEAPPPAVPAGAELIVRVRLACPEGCDLCAGSVRVTDSAGAERTLELPSGPDAELALVAPAKVGDVSWSILVPAQEAGGAHHEEAHLTLRSSVVPHPTSVAVWGVPSPLAGGTFGVRVGVKCSLGCGLGGRRVEIRYGESARLAEGWLGERPRPGTAALHEAEVVLLAPSRVGISSGRAVFDGSGPGLPHADSAADFTFRVLEPPEHTVAVSVVPRGVEAGLDGIEVRLGPYRAFTDLQGAARVEVAAGRYDVSIWRVDIEPCSAPLEVTGDAALELEARPRRHPDEDADRIWM
jgi:hypothetical protein